MKNIGDALLSLVPGAEWVTDGEKVSQWLSPDIDQPTQAEIDAEVARLQAEQDATQYRRNRATEYPEIGDQLDAILKHLNYRRTQGDELIQQLDDIIGDWLSVKSSHPKP